MRVLLLSDFYPPVRGGLEHHVDGLAAELALRGDDVTVATLTADPTPTSPYVSVRSISTGARLLPHERADRPFHPPLPEPVTRRSLRRVVRDFRPDIVHGHSWSTVSLGRIDAPVVFTAHDYALVCQLRTLLRSDGTLCPGPDRKVCVPCGAAVYGRARSTLMTAGTTAGRRLLQADKVLAVSEAVRSAIAPLTGTPVSVVPNFVGHEPAAEPLPTGLPATGFVLYAGDPGAHKGLPDLLAAWQGPDPVATPLVVATPRPVDGPLPPGVTATSLTPGQVAAAMRAASVVVVPSRWRDPCPTVVLEAMRAGTPVVGTRIGGIPELIRDGEDGLLVEPGDSVALAGAVRRLLTDAELYARIQANLAVRVAAFSVETVTDRIRAEYQLLAGARGGAR